MRTFRAFLRLLCRGRGLDDRVVQPPSVWNDRCDLKLCRGFGCRAYRRIGFRVYRVVAVFSHHVPSSDAVLPKCRPVSTKRR